MSVAFANGINIHYEVHGDGFPLVLIAGLGHASWSYFRQVEDLPRDLMVITFDNRGVGKTDKPEHDYSIGMFAEDTAGLLAALGIDKAHVLGASMGGYIAQVLAESRPDIVEKLVLVSTMFGGPSAVPMPASTLAFLTSRPQGTPGEIVKKGLALATSEDFVEREPDVVAEIVRFQLSCPQPGSAYLRQLAACAAFLADPSTERRLADIKAPTLILAGRDDKVVPAENAALLAEGIPGARCTIIEGAGHLVFIQKPDEFNSLVRGFLLEG